MWKARCPALLATFFLSTEEAVNAMRQPTPDALPSQPGLVQIELRVIIIKPLFVTCLKLTKTV
jgi:hypothetical protein